jgi:hypothetical protein
MKISTCQDLKFLGQGGIEAMAIERTKGTLRCKQKPIASIGRDHIHVSRRKAKEEDRDTKQRVIVIG